MGKGNEIESVALSVDMRKPAAAAAPAVSRQMYKRLLWKILNDLERVHLNILDTSDLIAQCPLLASKGAYAVAVCLKWEEGMNSGTVGRRTNAKPGKIRSEEGTNSGTVGRRTNVRPGEIAGSEMAEADGRK